MGIFVLLKISTPAIAFYRLNDTNSLCHLAAFSFRSSWLVISVYLSSQPVAHLSDAPRRRLVVTGIVQGYRTKLLRVPPGSLTCSTYSTVTRDLGLTSHPTDKGHVLRRLNLSYMTHHLSPHATGK